MDESKILLFIVEGLSDKTALAPALEKIVTNSKVKFKIMHTDITSDFDSTVANIERRIKEQAVKKFLNINSQFRSTNICGIVHIVDLDGVFIPDVKIVQANIEDAQYLDDSIVCKDRDMFLRSKSNKSSNILHLASLSKIAIPNGIIVPYSIYFMSCNLDHVLHNRRNSTQKEKTESSLVFADAYDDPKMFEDFFNDQNIKVTGSYEETWRFAQQELNSLKRGSNFWLCIDKYKS